MRILCTIKFNYRPEAVLKWIVRDRPWVHPSPPNLGNRKYINNGLLVSLFISAKRPPVEETASFLQSLLASHGPNYLEKLFGSKARDALAPLGGVEQVAVALSESQTIEDFGAALHLMR